jgi:hypothetical protein
LCHRIDDELLALAALLVEHFGDFFVGIRVEEAEGHVLEFPLEFPDAEPVGQRRVKFQRLARHLDPQITGIGGIEAQGLRPAGQTQHDDADILDHRQQHLAQHFDLRLDLDRVDFAGLDDWRRQNPLVIGRSRFSREMPPTRCAAGLPKRSSMRATMFVMRRNGKQHRRHARLGIDFQAGDDHGHAQRVRPDALAAA